VNIHLRDVAELISRAGENRYHAILLDVDNSPDPLMQKGNAKLYDGGRVVFWSANPDKSFARSLAKHFGNVQAIAAKAYPKAKRFTHTLFVADRV
jgi:hypothetical protein